MALHNPLVIASTLGVLALAPVAYAQTAFNTSYGPVPVTSTGVVAAAQFAAKTKSVTIKKILTAQQAATAHLHFHICMRVADGSKTYLVDTKVSRATGKPYNLDAWTTVKACK